MNMPTKERVLEAAGKCPQAKETLRILFPEYFKEEYVPQVGDVVAYAPRVASSDTELWGCEGVVVDVHYVDNDIGVFWNKRKPDGHGCDGRCPWGFGYYVPAQNLTLINRPEK